MQDNFNIIYDTLFREIYPKLFFYVKGMIGSEEDAQDIVEDVFVDLWHRRERIEVGDKIQAFLYRSAYTHTINYLKRKRKSENYIRSIKEINNLRMDFMLNNSKNPETDLENTELQKTLNAAINELPNKCCEVFKLSYIHGLQNDEIAKKMGTSVRTVEAHMYHALKYLRSRLSNIKLSMLLLLLVVLKCIFN